MRLLKYNPNAEQHRLDPSDLVNPGDLLILFKSYEILFKDAIQIYLASRGIHPYATRYDELALLYRADHYIEIKELWEDLKRIDKGE